MYVSATNIRIIAIHETLAEQSRRLLSGEGLMTPQEAKKFTMQRVSHIESMDDVQRFEYVMTGRKDRSTEYECA
jgi:hypothetical protein